MSVFFRKVTYYLVQVMFCVLCSTVGSLLVVCFQGDLCMIVGPVGSGKVRNNNKFELCNCRIFKITVWVSSFVND